MQATATSHVETVLSTVLVALDAQDTLGLDHVMGTVIQNFGRRPAALVGDCEYSWRL